MKEIEEKKVEEKIKKILKENLDVKKFSYFLFWSRAKGNYKKNSDFDIWILGDKKLEFEKYIRLKRILNEEINYNLDLVDFNRVTDDFKKIALKNIKIWNKWKNIKLI